jgi:hypothetical protein
MTNNKLTILYLAQRNVKLIIMGFIFSNEGKKLEDSIFKILDRNGNENLEFMRKYCSILSYCLEKAEEKAILNICKTLSQKIKDIKNIEDLNLTENEKNKIKNITQKTYDEFKALIKILKKQKLFSESKREDLVKLNQSLGKENLQLPPNTIIQFCENQDLNKLPLTDIYVEFVTSPAQDNQQNSL